MKKILALFLACSVYIVALAQPDSTGKPPPMKENWDNGIVNTLKQNGGIYAVIAVIAIILGGFFWYMMRLEKKMTRLEKEHGK